MTCTKRTTAFMPPTFLLTLAGFHLPVQAGPDTLTAVQADTAPTLDGVADDQAWQAAAPLELELTGGANFGGNGQTTGTLRAARVGDRLYIVLQYQDPTRSLRRFPYVKQADGSWEKLKSPENKGGDETEFYEDKAALIWSIDDSIEGFETEGCFTACHAGESPKPYGNKYTDTKGELGDIWHAKSVRLGPVGQIHDQYLDNTRFDPETAKDAGRHGDPKTGGGYTDIALKDGHPEFMPESGRTANDGGTYWLKEQNKVPFENSRFQTGDEFPSILVSPLEGDAGDIAGGMAWQDGVWTVEMGRKLVTGSPYDVQFDDLGDTYWFGVAVFDNAQVRHAYATEPVGLRFEQ